MLKSTAFTHSTLISLILLGSSAWATPSCESYSGCERKFCEIQNQLDRAQEQQLPHKAAGLNRALAEAKAHCSDSGLRDDLAAEISESKGDLAEYQADLKEAEQEGNTKKIRKYQRKIEQEQHKLKMLEDELSSVQ